MRTIRSILFVITMLALGACNLFGPSTPAADNALLAQLPALGLTIQVQNATDVFNTVGQIINYDYVITYTGTTALAAPAAISDPQTPVTCPDLITVGNFNNTLEQNETVVCKSAYSITQADLNTGTVTKNATGAVGGVSTNAANLVTALVQNKTLSLTKTANPLTYNQLGLIITYSYTVKNSGNVTLGPTQFVVNDDHIITPINCGTDQVTLLPTETVGCTAPYTIVQNDLNVAVVTNNATVSGGGAGPSQPASATINNSNMVQSNPNPANLPAGSTIQHKVVAGEWMIQIGRCYGASFTDIRNANTNILDPDVISVDTIVTVPRIGSVGKIYGPPCVTTHTVQSGDTWASIAQRYNADIVVLQAANPGSLLTVGSVIKIPLNSFSGVFTTPAPTLSVTLTPTLTPGPTLTASATSQPNPNDPIRITIPQGTNSTTVNGTLTGQAGVRYVVAGAQGQAMTVVITATPPNEIAWAIYDPSGLAIRPLDANTSWTGTLPANGDYRIELSGIGSSNKTYTLLVGITAP